MLRFSLGPGVGVLAAAERWRQRNKINRKGESCDKFSRVLATGLFEGSAQEEAASGSIAGTEKRGDYTEEQCHHAEGVSKHTFKNSSGSRYKHLAGINTVFG